MDEDKERIIRRVKTLKNFYSNLITFFLVNLLLLIINLLFSPQNLWFYWVTLIWGIVLIFQAINTFTIRNRLIGDEWEKKKVEELLRKEREKNLKP